MARQKNPVSTQPASLTHLKALSHPLRVGILRLLSDAEHTNEELADLLGVASGKLYFHTKKLLDAGMITLSGTRAKGPLTEKLYRAVAQRFALPDPVKGGDHPPLERLIACGLELYQQTWHATDGLPGETEYGFHFVLPHTAERKAEFVERLKSLMQDFQENESGTADKAPLALTVLLHSVPLPHQNSTNEESDSTCETTS